MCRLGVNLGVRLGVYLVVGLSLISGVGACNGEEGIEPKPTKPEPTEPELPPLDKSVILNEVMPGNQSTINGPDTTSLPDWIELVNTGEAPVPLSSLTLRNEEGERWTGPDGVEIAPGERLMVWASDEPVGEGLVTGFPLDKDGDKLALLDPYDRVIDAIQLDAVPSDVSYARTPDLTGPAVPTAWPTPGAANRDTASPTLNAASETVFVPLVMHRIDFTFTQQAYNAIDRYDRPEVHVEVDIDGVHYEDVGLKLKGSASYQNMNGKPAFIVDFNAWVQGTKFRGLKALKLHNGLVLDPTRNRDWLSYELARQAGLMAPRVGWAEVYCNDNYYGLYIVVEKHDDEFIEYHRPGQQDIGAMFEPNESEGTGWGWGDFGNGTINDWNREEGPEPPDPAVLASLAAADAIFSGPATDAALANLWNYMDQDKFLTYLAWETVVMHTDGYRAPNNWRVFVDGTTHKIELVPSGAEWTWDSGVTPWYYGGRAGWWCLENETCTRAYAERLVEIADLADEIGLVDKFVEQQTWLQPYQQSDPRYSTWQNIPQARQSTRNYLEQNPQHARQQVHQRYSDL